MVVYCLITENGDVGTYWTGLPTSDPGSGGNYKDRYLYDGTYRVYDGMLSFFNTFSKNEKDYNIDLTVEIQGAWYDDATGYSGGALITGFHTATVTTRIMGVYDPDSYHFGISGNGYVLYDAYSSRTVINISTKDSLVDGVEAIKGGTAGLVFGQSNNSSKTMNCIGSGGALAFPCYGTVENCIAFDSAIGFDMMAYNKAGTLQNCLAIQCTQGFDGTSHSYGFVANCIGFDNTTNWGTSPVSGSFTNNRGETGDTVWDTSFTSGFCISSDFKNYENPLTLVSDLSPSGDSSAHTSSSNFTDAGEQTYTSYSDSSLNNITRPSWKNDLTTKWDIGPFEFDWGYGIKPASVVIIITVVTSAGIPIEGVRVLLEATTGGNLAVGIDLLSGLTNASGIISTSISLATNQPIVGTARKSSTSPFYRSADIIGEIDYQTGYKQTLLLVLDE